MKLKPLGDRLIVQAIEEEETTASGIVLPDTAKEKPEGQGDRGWRRPGRGWRAPPARRERGRRGPLQQVRRHRDQGGWRRFARSARVGRPRQGHIASSRTRTVALWQSGRTELRH